MKKNGLKPVNRKAKRLEEREVFGMQDFDVMRDVITAMPIGCSTVFDTGWETNPRPTTPMGNCLSAARDLGSTMGPCWWPAQAPDGITNRMNFQNQCPALERDWRNLNFVIKR